MIKSYELVQTNLNRLAVAIKGESDLLKKSKEEGTFGDHVADVITLHNGSRKIAEELYTAFVELNEEYESGRMNQARYVSSLKIFKGFFDIADLDKNDLPDELHAKVILREIARYI